MLLFVVQAVFHGSTGVWLKEKLELLRRAVVDLGFEKAGTANDRGEIRKLMIFMTYLINVGFS